MKNVIKFKRKGRHAAMGLDIHINVSDIEAALGELSDKKQFYLQQSLIIHEVLHHIVEQEHFPMFLEMIYMLENDQIWRIENIKSLYLQRRLSQPYIRGLQKISEWLEFDHIEKMLEALAGIELGKLKETFRIKYEEYCQEDESLASQVAQIRQRIGLAA